MEVQKLNYITIKVNGSRLEKPTLDKLSFVEIDTSLHVPDMFIIELYDDTLELMDSNTFQLGDEVEISFSTIQEDSPDIRPVISGEITAIEPDFGKDVTATLTIRGYDKSHRLLRGTKSKTYINMTDSDIVKQVASAVGFSVTAQSTSVVHEHVFQHNQTDLNFIHERARLNGYEIMIEKNKLYFRPLSGDRGTVDLQWGQTLKQFRPRVTLSRQVKEVFVNGWDPTKKKEIIGKSSSSDKSPRISDGNLLNGGQVADSVFNTAKYMNVNYPVATQQEADNLAQAIMDEVNTNFVQADGIAKGNPDLVAGNAINVTNLGNRFSGKYVITSAIHRYSNDDYDVMISVEGTKRTLVSDLVRGSDISQQQTSAWGGIVPALVVNNEDPEDMGRVQVIFPWLDKDLVSHWARVISIGSGNERGIYWLPELDDEVLVAFEHGDFNQPYVIGSVWNGKDKPPEAIGSAVEGGNVIHHTFKTRKGHTIQMVDDGGAGYHIKIFDGEQINTMTFDAKNRVFDLNCKGKINVEATDTVTLKGTSNINIEATGNLVLKATGNVDIEGTMVNIKGSGVVKVQGGMVNIN